MKKILTTLLVLPALFLLLSGSCYGAEGVTEAADVVVFAHFSDDTQETADAYFAQQLQTYKGYFNGSSGRAFANYMNTVSYGQYKANVYFPQDDGSGTIQSIPLNISQAEAKQSNVDGNVIDTVLNQMPSLTGYTVDCDGDGYIDNITVILKAENVSDSSVVSTGATLVAHSNTSGNAGTCQGYRVCNYNLLPTERLNTVESGLIIHEYLHTLGYPDLYRTDSSGDSPVYVWDIMGSASPRPSWPLAFLRSRLSGWLRINEITADGTYILQEQASASGDRAFIIKSPMNSSEYFVVEYRRRPAALYDSNTLDRDLQGSGIIVYRVNETVYEYSNKDSSQTGIYVFRPQSGQAGYVSGSDSQTVLNAYLSSESGRTAIGSGDLNAGLSDGALTFSDGSNSGIVISNVGTAAGSSITFDVTFPDLTETDLWTDTQYASGTSITAEDITIVEHQGEIYTVEYTGSGFKAARYGGDGSWTSVSGVLSDTGYSGTGMKCVSYNGNLYLMYMTMSNGLKVYSLNGDGTWRSVTSLSDAVNYFDCSMIGDSVYVTYLSGDLGEKANAAVFTGSAFSKKGTYHTSTFANGRTRVVNYGGTPYLFVRDASSPSTLYGYKYQSGSFVKTTDGTVKCDDYDVMVFGDHIYASGANGTLQVSDYNGSTWSTVTSDISTAEATMTVIDGHVYAIASPATGEQKNFKMYLFDRGSFIQEGDTSIDAASRSFTVLTKGNQLFLSYVRTHDGKAFIKRKEINTANITGHVYNVSFQWSTDKKSCQAILTCSHCEDTAAEKTVTYNCTVTGQTTKQAYCNAKGEITYTASVTTAEKGALADSVKVETAKNVSKHAGGTVVRNKKEATTTAKGYSGDTYCKGCGALLKAGSETAKLAASVTYTTHVQNVGWQAWVKNGAMAGTSGRSLRLEGIKIKLTDLKSVTGGISYRTHIQKIGWEKTWKSNGQMSGTSGRSLRLEAIQIKLTGKMAEKYDVYYCVHAQDYGWLGWAKNGQSAGTAGYAKRLEGIKIKLVPKGGKAPAPVNGTTKKAYISK